MTAWRLDAQGKEPIRQFSKLIPPSTFTNLLKEILRPARRTRSEPRVLFAPTQRSQPA